MTVIRIIRNPDGKEIDLSTKSNEMLLAMFNYLTNKYEELGKEQGYNDALVMIKEELTERKIPLYRFNN